MLTKNGLIIKNVTDFNIIIIIMSSRHKYGNIYMEIDSKMESRSQNERHERICVSV